jgi:hypothetical protein
MIELVNEIINEYQQAGYILSLRQLYYQLVSRDIIPNKQNEYIKLSGILKIARMNGLTDWTAIEDRTRKPKIPSYWENPQDILQDAINSYQVDRQLSQNVHIEVMIEKDALSSIVSRITSKYGIPLSINRGYSSCSSVYSTYQRIINSEKKQVKILYCGDYDPSGIDMIADLTNRINEFIIGDLIFNRINQSFDFDIIPIALTREQIELYNPPPNPVKMTDSRAKKFIKDLGCNCYEVDALRPDVLTDILENSILENIDLTKYEEAIKIEQVHKKKLSKLIAYLEDDI